MKFGSVCSGIEAASQAWQPLGWKAAWFSEIEPFPCAVLAHHYPDTPNFGDMTKFESWPTDDKHAIDLLCGGTPCQSFSVAGLRKGLDDPRGNLMLTFGSVADKYRPKWLVWENVPGVLSSNGGRDFGGFLGMLGKLGYGFAYRVLDAQYFGVAQRRRRVFVVGCLGDWRSAAAVFFERHSLSGHPAPRRSSRESVAGTITAGAFVGGAGCRPDGAAGTKQWLGNQEALTGDYHILQPAYGIQSTIIGRSETSGSQGSGFSEDVSFTLTKTDQHGVVAPTLTSSGDAHSGFRDEYGLIVSPIAWSEEPTPSIDCASTMQRGGQGGRHEGVMTPAMQVRRLTPMECERLQGFPDGYTNVPWRTYQEADRKGVSYEGLLNQRGMKLLGPSVEECPDGPRYKALGNSWAVPCVRWIGERIQTVEGIAALIGQHAQQRLIV